METRSHISHRLCKVWEFIKTSQEPSRTIPDGKKVFAVKTPSFWDLANGQYHPVIHEGHLIRDGYEFVPHKKDGEPAARSFKRDTLFICTSREEAYKVVKSTVSAMLELLKKEWEDECDAFGKEKCNIPYPNPYRLTYDGALGSYLMEFSQEISEKLNDLSEEQTESLSEAMSRCVFVDEWDSEFVTFAKDVDDNPYDGLKVSSDGTVSFPEAVVETAENVMEAIYSVIGEKGE